MRATGFAEIDWTCIGYEPRLNTWKGSALVQRVYSNYFRKRLNALSKADGEAVKRVFLDFDARYSPEAGGSAIHAALFVSERKP